MSVIRHALLRVRWRLHLLRGVLVVLMLSLFTYGLQTLGLAEAYTLFFIAPLLITMRLEEYDYAGAATIGVVMLAASFAILLISNFLSNGGRKRTGR